MFHLKISVKGQSCKCIEWIGCIPLLVTQFTEKNHSIWDRGETLGRLLLAKIVGCYIPCPINLYGCIGYIYCRNGFTLSLCMLWWEIKILLFSWNSVPKIRRHNVLNQWLPPSQTQLGMLPQDGSTRLYWLRRLIKLCMAFVQLNVVNK